MLTEEQIAEIRARAEAATPESWILDGIPVTRPDLHFIKHARDDIHALLSALAAAQAANRPRDDYWLFCDQCGRAHILDTVLPSEIWNKIASPNDLLCVVCIDARLKKAGLTADAEFYYSGDALRSRLYGDADALEAQAAELAEVRQQYVDANEARIDAEAQLAERGKLFIAAAEEAYWLLAWTWQSHLTGPGKPFDMSIFTPEARNMMTNAERNLFDALSEIEP